MGTISRKLFSSSLCMTPDSDRKPDDPFPIYQDPHPDPFRAQENAALVTFGIYLDSSLNRVHVAVQDCTFHDKEER